MFGKLIIGYRLLVTLTIYVVRRTPHHNHIELISLGSPAVGVMALLMAIYLGFSPEKGAATGLLVIWCGVVLKWTLGRRARRSV